MSNPHPNVADISHYQEVTSFTAMHAFGVLGVIHKVTQGLSYVDRMCVTRRPAITSAGMLFGVYHFGEGGDPAGQARHCLDATQPDTDTLVALDLEPNPSGQTMTIPEARVFLETVERELGRRAVLYAGYYTLHGKMGADADYLVQHRLWLAAYKDRPDVPEGWSAPWLHQFSGDGKNNHGITVPGIRNGDKIDMDYFAGPEDELRAQWSGGGTSSTPVVSTTDTPPADLGGTIRVLQQALLDAGFNPRGIDGRYGPGTNGALSRYVRAHGHADGDPVAAAVRQMQKALKAAGHDPGGADGVVGPHTRAALRAAGEPL